jgi:hypothetical protein
MANRSYLFATNSYNAPSEGYVATGMSEFAYQVHPLYELMVSQDAIIANSQLWDRQNISIVGDLAKGKQLVIDFLHMLYALDENFQTEDFKEFITETIDFLGKRNEKYALLEAGEIYELEDDELEVMNQTYFESAKENAAEIMRLLEKHKNEQLTAEELSSSSFYDDFVEISTEYGEWEIDEIDWVDFWSTILYFSLDGEEDEEDE